MYIHYIRVYKVCNNRYVSVIVCSSFALQFYNFFGDEKKINSRIRRSSGNGNYNGMGGKMRASLNLYYIRMSR